MMSYYFKLLKRCGILYSSGRGLINNKNNLSVVIREKAEQVGIDTNIAKTGR